MTVIRYADDGIVDLPVVLGDDQLRRTIGLVRRENLVGCWAAVDCADRQD